MDHAQATSFTLFRKTTTILVTVSFTRRVNIVQTQHLHSLTDFQLSTADHIGQLKQAGLPEVLTVNGCYLGPSQDAGEFAVRRDCVCEPSLGGAKILWGVWLMVLLVVLFTLILRYTHFGRHIFSVCSNEHAATLCGINGAKVKIFDYMIGGVVASLAAVTNLAKSSGGNLTAACATARRERPTKLRCQG